jgi:hypothetical protein
MNEVFWFPHEFGSGLYRANIPWANLTGMVTFERKRWTATVVSNPVASETCHSLVLTTGRLTALDAMNAVENFADNLPRA